MNEYLALLRGINVGGNSIIKMTDLKTCFENMGLSDVATYIQSGNVLFKFGEKEKSKLTIQIEKNLSQTFGYNLKIVLINYFELNRIVKEAPEKFGSEPENYRYDTIFLKEPLTSDEAMSYLRIKEGVDNAWAGKEVLYFSRLIAKASQSYLAKTISQPVYKNMTIRNWNTTTRLLQMMEKRGVSYSLNYLTT